DTAPERAIDRRGDICRDWRAGAHLEGLQHGHSWHEPEPISATATAQHGARRTAVRKADARHDQHLRQALWILRAWALCHVLPPDLRGSPLRNTAAHDRFP